MDKLTNSEYALIKQARDLLITVPGDEWIKTKFTDGFNKCCAIGHYMRLTSDNPDDYSINNCRDWDVPSPFRRVTRNAARIMLRDNGIRIDVTHINNHAEHNGWTEDEIKDRVIHFLNDALLIEEGILPKKPNWFKKKIKKILKGV